MLHALGDNRERSKLLNIKANLKNIFKNVEYLLVTELCKKRLKTDYENLMHVYLYEILQGKAQCQSSSQKITQCV
jgi:hypothetical protein